MYTQHEEWCSIAAHGKGCWVCQRLIFRLCSKAMGRGVFFLRANHSPDYKSRLWQNTPVPFSILTFAHLEVSTTSVSFWKTDILTHSRFPSPSQLRTGTQALLRNEWRSICDELGKSKGPKSSLPRLSFSACQRRKTKLSLHNQNYSGILSWSALFTFNSRL